MTQRVTIVQEYIPAYRRPFFEALRAIATSQGWQLSVVAGAPGGAQAIRGDATSGADFRPRGVRLQLAGRRLEWRRLPKDARNADLIIFEQARRNLDAHIALRRTGRRVGLWGHGFDHAPNVSARDEALLKQMTLRADWFFGYTSASAEHVIAYGYPASQVTVVNNSTDTVSLRQRLADVATGDIARLLGTSASDAPVAAYVGALDATKRLDFLVTAADIVAQNIPGFKLLLVGDGPMRTTVRSGAADRPWITVTGRLGGQELATVLRASSAIVCPGAVGLVAVDALAAGLPVVTTDWPHHGPERSYLTSENSVTTSDSPAAYAEGLMRLFRDRELRLRLSAQAERDSRAYSIEQMASVFAEGIRRALAS